MKDVFEQMADAWKAPVVARSEVSQFSGGLLNPRTIANLDCLGQGPDELVKFGRKVGYLTSALVDWMRKRAESVSKGQEGA